MTDVDTLNENDEAATAFTDVMVRSEILNNQWSLGRIMLVRIMYSKKLINRLLTIKYQKIIINPTRLKVDNNIFFKT